MRVFENRVLRRIFRLKRDEVTVEWRKLHNEELISSAIKNKSYFLLRAIHMHIAVYPK
jgi:hypothetical protein